MSFLQDVIETGLSKSQSQGEADRLRILNGTSFLCVILGLIAGIIIVLQGAFFVASMVALTISMMGSVLIFNAFKRHHGAKMVYVLTSNLATLTLSVLIGHGSGFQLYYLISPLIVLIIFSMDQFKMVMFCLLSYLLSFLLIEYYHFLNFQPLFEVSSLMLETFFVMNSIVGIIIAMSLVIGYSVLHRRATIELNKKSTDLESSLKAKKVLLAEIHHRVNNNLSVIAGLINMQSNQSKSNEARGALNLASNRISAMGMVHNLLYSDGNVDDIKLECFVETFVENIDKEYREKDTRVNYKLHINNIGLSLDQAIPLFLILNEVLTNSLKHAFKGRTEGEIVVDIQRTNQQTNVTITDNGIGFLPKSSSSGIGLYLIDCLTEQLNGEYSFHFDSDTHFSLKF